MDLWLECVKIDERPHSITPGMEYQVIDINPLRGLVRVINNNDKPCWFSEKRFKTNRKKEVEIMDRNIVGMKQKYAPILVELNVEGTQLTASVAYVDSNLPETDSLNKTLGVFAPFGLDVSIRKSHRGIAIELTEDREMARNGVYASNGEALEYAAKARKTINYFNDILTRTEYELAIVYIVEFCPGGKQYTFRSNDKLKADDFVVCSSCTGKQYAKVVRVSTESVHDYKSRSFCQKYNA